MAIADLTLETLSTDELAHLINETRYLRSNKVTPSVKINRNVGSVGKHVDAVLQAIKKLVRSEGVPVYPADWPARHFTP